MKDQKKMNDLFDNDLKDRYFNRKRKIVKLIRSVDDWEGFKEQTRLLYYSKFPREKANIDCFIQFLGERFDKYRRVFLPTNLIFYLWGKRNAAIKNNTHFWVSFIGKSGGEGKSTNADYFSMIFDPTYHEGRREQDYDKWISMILQAKKETRRPAVVLDEPDVETHDLSKKGRQRKNILERIRILHLFVSVCANSLTSIPSSIYERLNAIVYVKKNHKFFIWDSERDRMGTVIEDIKGPKGWGTYKHGVFQRSEFLKRACFSNLSCANPRFDPFRGKKYDVKKEDDVLNLITRYNSKHEDSEEVKVTEDPNLTKIRDLKRKYPQFTQERIGKRLGLSREWVNKLWNKAVKREGGTIIL